VPRSVCSTDLRRMRIAYTTSAHACRMPSEAHDDTRRQLSDAGVTCTDCLRHQLTLTTIETRNILSVIRRMSRLADHVLAHSMLFHRPAGPRPGHIRGIHKLRGRCLVSFSSSTTTPLHSTTSPLLPHTRGTRNLWLYALINNHPTPTGINQFHLLLDTTTTRNIHQYANLVDHSYSFDRCRNCRCGSHSAR
jgi:hypothetical protein